MAVNLIFGPPGTGKTTYLIEQVVAKELPNTSPDRIGYFAFTQKAAREALNRALVFFPDSVTIQGCNGLGRLTFRSSIT